MTKKVLRVAALKDSKRMRTDAVRDVQVNNFAVSYNRVCSRTLSNSNNRMSYGEF